MSGSFIINRHIAITSVNIYHEIQNEASNRVNQDEFKNSFIKFIMSYIKNIKFTETIAERLFYSIYTFDLAHNAYIMDDESNDYSDYDDNLEYAFNNFTTYNELKRLNLSIKNYYLINVMKNNSFINNSFNFINHIFDSTIQKKCLLDFEMEENDCTICNWHGYDSAWPEEDKRGKFYYSIPYKLNEPVCHFCVNNKLKNKEDEHEEVIDNSDDEITHTHTRTEKEEIDYLKENDLVKCGNCGSIWDGYAQCGCYADTDCYIYQDCYTNKADPIEQSVEEPIEEPIQKGIKMPPPISEERLKAHFKRIDIGAPRLQTSFNQNFKEESLEEKKYIRSPPPTRPVPVPNLYVDKPNNIIKKLKEENMILEEENRILVEKYASLKFKLKELAMN
jgi:hypothetical protein